jgi:large repetitive protein
MRFAVVLLLVAAVAAVAASDSLAIRFADTPCVEAGAARMCPVGVVGNPYLVQLNGEGGCGPDPSVPGSGLPYQYRVLNGSLPAGLVLDKDGLLHGTPAEAGTWSFWVELSDEDPPSAAWCRPAKSEREFIVSIAAPPATVGSKYAVQVTAEGVDAVTWSVASGTLPPGLGLNATTGVITGTPAITGTFPFKLLVTDTRGVTATVDATITVYPTLSLAPTRLAPARVGRSYRATVRASGSVQPVVFSVRTGRLPTGLRLNTRTGVLSGKPRKPGRYTLTFVAQDGLRRTAKETYVLTVLRAPLRRA